MTSRIKIPKNFRGCVFCKQTTNDELAFGGLKVSKNLRAHYYCMLFSETISQSGLDHQGILGFLPSDILAELRRAKQKKCCYCTQAGASLSCAHKFCNRKYHLSCGLEKNTQQDFRDFTSYCHNHRKSSNVPVRLKRCITESKCLICLEEFEPNTDISNVIWADCCKADVLMHLQCIKKMALSAGYFTKCPGCNNKDAFIDTIKIYGVFVPERDASWELCRNAYSELYYVHQTCDVAECLCPQGRDYSITKGKWKMYLCNMCGSFGTHQLCSEVRRRFVCCVCNVNEASTNNDNSESIELDCNTGQDNSSVDILKDVISKTHLKDEDDEDQIVDALDDIIVLDSGSEEDVNEAVILNKISIAEMEATQTNDMLNIPSSSKLRSESRTTTQRKVALKSTTKLPFRLKRERFNFDVEVKPAEETMAPPADVICLDSDDDKNHDQELNKILHDNDALSYNSENARNKVLILSTSPNRLKAHQTERRVAMKSTSKLPPLKHKISVLENIGKLEKNTINSLDDTIILDSCSDEDPSDTTETKYNPVLKTVINTTPAFLNKPSTSSLKSSQSDRRVAMKSTTKLPPLKRKISDMENFTEEQHFQYVEYDKFYNSKSINNSLQWESDLSSILNKSATIPSPCNYDNVIQKVNAVIKNTEMNEGGSFSLEDGEPVEDYPVTHTPNLNGKQTDPLNMKETPLHYNISLDVDGEIEFVNYPNFSVTAQGDPEMDD